MNACKTSEATATRDLQYLDKIGALSVKGAGRNTHYIIDFQKTLKTLINIDLYLCIIG